jgi:IMP dehydrogenase
MLNSFKLNKLDHDITVNDILLRPGRGRYESRKDIPLEGFIYNAPMDTVGGYDLCKKMLELGQYAVLCRNIDFAEYLRAIVDFHQHPRFFVAIPADVSLFVRDILSLESISSCNVALDVAHGWSVGMFTGLNILRFHPKIRRIMSGSIATGPAARDLISHGVTDLRVGIGCGSVCTTRLMTGVGVSQLSAVIEVAEHVSLLPDEVCEKVTIIADGGIKYPGDAVKYLAAGANAVMLGSLLAPCVEAYGWKGSKDRYKHYRGHASYNFQRANGKTTPHVEGVSTAIIYLNSNYTVQSVVDEFNSSLTSAISYIGVTTQRDLQTKQIHFSLITSNGLNESRAHHPGAI